MKFKYLVLGNHPIFRYINRRCITLEEAKNVKDGLEVIGYEVEIKPLKKENNHGIQTNK